jgi:hypothetical protein
MPISSSKPLLGFKNVAALALGYTGVVHQHIETSGSGARVAYHEARRSAAEEISQPKMSTPVSAKTLGGPGVHDRFHDLMSLCQLQGDGQARYRVACPSDDAGHNERISDAGFRFRSSPARNPAFTSTRYILTGSEAKPSWSRREGTLSRSTCTAPPARARMRRQWRPLSAPKIPPSMAPTAAVPPMTFRSYFPAIRSTW